MKAPPVITHDPDTAKFDAEPVSDWTASNRDSTVIEVASSISRTDSSASLGSFSFIDGKTTVRSPPRSYTGSIAETEDDDVNTNGREAMPSRWDGYQFDLPPRLAQLHMDMSFAALRLGDVEAGVKEMYSAIGLCAPQIADPLLGDTLAKARLGLIASGETILKDAEDYERWMILFTNTVEYLMRCEYENDRLWTIELEIILKDIIRSAYSLTGKIGSSEFRKALRTRRRQMQSFMNLTGQRYYR